MDDPHERLQAFCSITLDGSFVIRDLKIIQGTKGSFVAMPSRKLTDRCPRCGNKNHLRANFCNQCGVQLDEDRAFRDTDGRAKLYADIAHPINSVCRENIQDEVLVAYQEELIRAKQADYVCRYDDYGEENFARLADHSDEEPTGAQPTNGSGTASQPERHPVPAPKFASSTSNGVAAGPVMATNGASAEGQRANGSATRINGKPGEHFGDGIM